jgi:hypothetical protein
LEVVAELSRLAFFVDDVGIVELAIGEVGEGGGRTGRRKGRGRWRGACRCVGIGRAWEWRRSIEWIALLLATALAISVILLVSLSVRRERILSAV